jgi:hypothetical protein
MIEETGMIRAKLVQGSPRFSFQAVSTAELKPPKGVLP